MFELAGGARPSGCRARPRELLASNISGSLSTDGLRSENTASRSVRTLDRVGWRDGRSVRTRPSFEMPALTTRGDLVRSDSEQARCCGHRVIASPSGWGGWSGPPCAADCVRHRCTAHRLRQVGAGVLRALLRRRRAGCGDCHRSRRVEARMMRDPYNPIQKAVVPSDRRSVFRPLTHCTTIRVDWDGVCGKPSVLDLLRALVCLQIKRPEFGVWCVGGDR